MRHVRIPLLLHALYPVPSVEIRLLRDNIVVVAFSQQVIGFNLSDVEITGGTVSDFIGNGREFFLTIETENSAEIYVPAGVCESENGVLNLESNRFIYDA